MQTQLPCRLCEDVADRLVGPRTLASAYEAIRSVFLDTLRVDVLILARRNQQWQRVAGRATPALESAWLDAARNWGFAPEIIRQIDNPEPSTGVWVQDSDPTVLVLGGHWAHSADVLESCGRILTLGLSRARTEEIHRATQRTMSRALKLAYLGSAATDQQLLATKLVARVAAMFQADRVSVALFSPSEDALQIVASTGVPGDVAKRARINPRDWAVGYVYTSSSVLTVSDVRVLPSRNPNRARYKTHSFAVVPLVFGDKTIGVLSITDRRDGISFTSADRVALRLIGAAAGAALSAAAGHENMQRLEHQATTDSITGLFNRGHLDTRLLEEVERAQREHTELAVLIADIDDFKAINDRFGHQMGDAVLKQVGEIIRSSVRMFDVCARFGGDEFAVLMPNSDQASAFACAERIRQKAAQYVNSLDASLPLTLSVGVAVGGAQDGAASIVGRADRALYRAKDAGKNAVRGEGDAAQPAPKESVTVEWAETSEQMRLPYVLVADSVADRIPLYKEAAQAHRLGLLVASDAPQALRLIQQFGPPLLLVVDLAMPEMQHLALNSISNAERDVSVLAFSESRELREFFRASPNAERIHVLTRDASTDVVRVVLSRLLRSTYDSSEARVDADPQQRLAMSLTKRTRAVVDTSGAAAYVKDPVDGHMRAVVRWAGDAALMRSQNFIPRLIDEVLDRDDLVMFGDVGPRQAHEDSHGWSYAGAHALIGTPIRQDDEVVGSLCVFDDKPVRLSAQAVTDFEELGSTAMQESPVVSAADEISSEQERPAAAGEINEERRTAADEINEERRTPADEINEERRAPADEINEERRAPVDENNEERRTPADELYEERRALPDQIDQDRRAHRDDHVQVHETQPPVVPARPESYEGIPTLLERQRGEFEVARELARARREQRQMSVVLFDVSQRMRQQRRDSGDEPPDDALERVVETFVRAVRQSDLPIRWSGSELLLVLPGLAGVEARSVAERVRAAMEAGGQRHVAVSGGVAQLELDEQFGAVVERARAKVAQALVRGNNRVS
jgi:diguanylate cyclase (GGDEF)-like protein